MSPARRRARETEPAPPGRVLSVFAHPDDQEFTVAGTLAKWARAGSEIVTVCITSGSAGSNQYTPLDMTRETLVPIREAEQREACRLLRVADVVFLGYEDGMLEPSLAAAAGICVAIVALRRIHVQADAAYVAMGVGLWFALRSAGVSPTLAGVALGLLTPCVPLNRPRTVSEEADRVADETVDDPVPPDADAAQWFYLADLARDAVSPLARMESLLHPWASYVVVPLFALSNAGVPLTGHALAAGATSRVAVAIVAARVLGKTLGISIASGLAVRIGLARLPRGVSWRHVIGVAAAAGIPFTVSLFVAELSIRPGTVLDSAKLGILATALIAGLAGFLLLRSADRRPAAALR